MSSLKERPAGGRAGGSGWDVGERPTVRMAYLEYPVYAPPHDGVHVRDEAEMRLGSGVWTVRRWPPFSVGS